MAGIAPRRLHLDVLLVQQPSLLHAVARQAKIHQVEPSEPHGDSGQPECAHNWYIATICRKHVGSDGNEAKSAQYESNPEVHELRRR